MSQTITAIYADGVLRPLVPLALPEQSEVEIEIKSAPTAEHDALAERIRVHQILVDAGLVEDTGLWQAAPVLPISPEEEEELGRAFAVGKPLSEIIIEDRDEHF